MNVNYFCVHHENRQKHTQHFKLLFFKKNLHFGASEQMSTCGKPNLLPIKGIFLVFSSREKQRRLIQTKIYYNSLQYTLVCMPNKLLKVTAEKKVIPNLLRFMFFIPCNNWKTLFFTQIQHYPEFWCNRHVAAFLATSVLKQVCILCPLSPKYRFHASLQCC